MTQTTQTNIAIVGAGPSGLVMAIALARKGITSTVFERDQHPDIAPRFNPDRSYSIDITGHGLRALRYIDACDRFDELLIQFKGIKLVTNGQVDSWDEPGWTGSRGDILRTLLAEIEAKYSDLIALCYLCDVTAVDVHNGRVTTDTEGVTDVQTFDLIIGADGGGSIVRREMEAQLPEFTTEYDEIPNYSTMLELDRNVEDLDVRYLHIFQNDPFCVAGAVNGGQGDGTVRWFCVVGTNKEQTFDSVEDARQMFASKAPKMLDMVSEESLSSFAGRQCLHIGKMLSCSQLYGGKAVLLGDAGAPFSPIGQGINAALESAMVLDQNLDTGRVAALYQSLVRYSDIWKPEADAVTWICRKFIFGHTPHTIRLYLTAGLGVNAFTNAKKSDLSYSEAKKQAERLGPVWM